MKLILATVLFALSTATSSFASLFVNTGSTEGTCASTSNNLIKGYFEVTSFSFGGSRPISADAIHDGNLTLGNLIIGKPFDNCSGVLVTQFLQGKNLGTVTLIETEQLAQNPTGMITILSITLTNAIVSSYSLAASGSALEMESISFAFTKACIASTAVASNGTKATSTTCYDSATNTVY